MSEAYVGEIRRFPYQQIPDGWLACDGTVVPTDRYPVLYKVIGNTYGGDAGGSTFTLPNLQNAVAVSQGGNAGALGVAVYVPGPEAAYQTVCFAINTIGLYPVPPSE
ncbi:MAG TPA: phage tail protein [Thermoanaerobaculia bacterium]